MILGIFVSFGKQHYYQKRININSGWKFYFGDDAGPYDASYDDRTGCKWIFHMTGLSKFRLRNNKTESLLSALAALSVVVGTISAK